MLFDGDACTLASRLIGVTFLFNGVGGLIVETEAYLRDDPASHSFRGPDRRNVSMFAGAGHAYVYRSYGLHWCFNVVAESAGAVLIRALHPQYGIDRMIQNRGRSDSLCDGPGRLTQALGITGQLDGMPLIHPAFTWVDRTAVPEMLVGPRIGISKAAEQPWRFGMLGSQHLSRPFRQRFLEPDGVQLP